jgi:NitT/TauT family transport system substrate-binding protein
MVRQVNMEFTHLNPALKDKVEIPKFGMAANPAEIQKTEDIMMKYGLLKKPVDMSGRILKIQ